MNKDFKPCGEGDNICNCKFDNECGYLNKYQTMKNLKEAQKRSKPNLDNISTYVGRHSFFSIALRNGVSKSEISELAGHADFQTTEHYLAGFNGEQLAASANIVRNAVAQYTQEKTSVLEHKITLNDTGERHTVFDFLNKIWTDALEEEQNATHLLIALLQQTDCNDGLKAQEYVNCFLQSQGKENITQI